jgi:hypothetical protein
MRVVKVRGSGPLKGEVYYGQVSVQSKGREFAIVILDEEVFPTCEDENQRGKFFAVCPHTGGIVLQGEIVSDLLIVDSHDMNYVRGAMED